MKHPKIVRAAIAHSTSLFMLAEALATEIPPGSPRGELEQVVQEIVESGGDNYRVDTLREYRLTALHFETDTNMFVWAERDGKQVSFTSHHDAYTAGVSADEFRKDPKTSRELRKDSGKKSKDGPLSKRLAEEDPKAVAAAVADLPEEQRVAVAKELAHDPIIQNTAIVQADKDSKEKEKDRKKRPKAETEIDRVLERTDIRFAIRDAEKATERVLAGRRMDEFDDDDAAAFEMYAGRAYALGDLLRNLASAIRESKTFDLDHELARMIEEGA